MTEALQAFQSHRKIGRLYQGENGNAVALDSRVTGDLVETTKLQHYFQGLEVIGSMAFHHLGRKGAEIHDEIRSFDLETTPSVSVEEAVAIAHSETGELGLEALPELKILPSEDGSARLIYWVNVPSTAGQAGHDVLIDAHSGQVIASISKHENFGGMSSVFSRKPPAPTPPKPPAPAPIPAPPVPAPSNGRTAPVYTYNAAKQGAVVEIQGSGQTIQSCKVTDIVSGKSQQYNGKDCDALLKSKQFEDSQCQIILNGDPVFVTPEKCRLQVQNGLPAAGADASAVRAAKNSQTVLTYYLSHLNRNSYDDKGSKSVSIVHAGDHYDNAHWDTEKNQMVYGDGDGKSLGDFTLALDVAGHEMSHGVTAYSAKLLNFGESGALNEANSDFFGVLIAGAKDWAIGKELFLDHSKAVGVRDLANPANVSYRIRRNGQVVNVPGPANIRDLLVIGANEKCGDTNDQCYVHGNATIPGHAYYLEFMAIGQEKAEKLHYATLTQALNKNSTIRTAADAEKRMCRQMFDSATCTKVDQAWAQVGL